jgi:hypothetical protein
MKANYWEKQWVRRGFTLIELAMVTGLGLVVAAMLMALASQQLAFLRIYSAQNFLTEEAPLVSLHVSRLISKADRFRLHANVAEALAGTNPRLESSPVLLLDYQQPNGDMRRALLSFETGPDGNSLFYYLVPPVGQVGEPEWTITRKASNVSFFVQEGILRMKLTGRGGEEVTYSGTMQR